MLSIYLSLLDSPDEVCRFEEIYNKYNVVMGKIALSILHNESDAFDATHNALIAIAKNIKKFPDSTNQEYERAYVNVVIRHAAINVLRKNKRNVKLVHIDMDKYFNNHSAEDDIAQKDEIERISKHIDNMSEIYHDVLRMKYLYNMSVHEISDILGLSENTVRSKLRRGTKQLQEAIKSGGVL